MAFEVEFSKRLDLFGAEIFAALNDKKVALEAQGKKLYNLSVGTPDFEPMPHIKPVSYTHLDVYKRQGS